MPTERDLIGGFAPGDARTIRRFVKMDPGRVAEAATLISRTEEAPESPVLFTLDITLVDSPAGQITLHNAAQNLYELRFELQPIHTVDADGYWAEIRVTDDMANELSTHLGMFRTIPPIAGRETPPASGIMLIDKADGSAKLLDISGTTPRVDGVAVTGAQGPQGNQGVQGDQGLQGPPGEGLQVFADDAARDAALPAPPTNIAVLNLERRRFERFNSVAYENAAEPVTDRLHARAQKVPANGATAADTALTALWALVAAEGGNVYFAPGRYRITANHTVPDGVVLEMARGARFVIDAGITLTINGEIFAGRYQIFEGDDDAVRFGISTGVTGNRHAVLPEWFGAKPSFAVADAIDNITAFDRALLSIARPNGGAITSNELTTWRYASRPISLAAGGYFLAWPWRIASILGLVVHGAGKGNGLAAGAPTPGGMISGQTALLVHTPNTSKQLVVSATANTLTQGTYVWDVNRFQKRDFIVYAQYTEGGQAITGATSTTITRTGAGWTANEWVGAVVKIIINNRPYRNTVSSNTTDTLSFSKPWLITPTVSETFELVLRQRRRIVSNTADTLTIDATWATIPDASYEFWISALCVMELDGAAYGTFSDFAVQGGDQNQLGTFTDYGIYQHRNADRVIGNTTRNHWYDVSVSGGSNEWSGGGSGYRRAGWRIGNDLINGGAQNHQEDLDLYIGCGAYGLAGSDETDILGAYHTGWHIGTGVFGNNLNHTMIGCDSVHHRWNIECDATGYIWIGGTIQDGIEAEHHVTSGVQGYMQVQGVRYEGTRRLLLGLSSVQRNFNSFTFRGLEVKMHNTGGELFTKPGYGFAPVIDVFNLAGVIRLEDSRILNTLFYPRDFDGDFYTVSAATATTISQADGRAYVQFDVINALRGIEDWIVEITWGRGVGQWRRIISATASTATIDSAWDVIPDTNSRFKIYIRTGFVVAGRTKLIVDGLGLQFGVEESFRGVDSSGPGGEFDIFGQIELRNWWPLNSPGSSDVSERAWPRGDRLLTAGNESPTVDLPPRHEPRFSAVRVGALETAPLPDSFLSIGFVGAGSGTPHRYKLIAKDPRGRRRLATGPVDKDGPAVLDNSNYMELLTNDSPSASSFDILKETTPGSGVYNSIALDYSPDRLPFIDNGSHISAAYVEPTRDETQDASFGGFLDMAENVDPGAPAANTGRLYVQDNGGGKSQLVIRFPSGAVQVIATEP